MHAQFALAPILFLAGTAPCQAQSPAAPVHLPDPSRSPLAEPGQDDPILKLANEQATPEQFNATISAAVDASPDIAEALAEGRATLAARRASVAQLFPTIDLALSANRAVAREFSNDPDNIIERSRGAGRVDATASLQQLLFDFGASGRRIAAAAARIEAAEAELDNRREATALRMIGAWYDLFAYGRLVTLAESYLDNEPNLRAALQRRIDLGVSAPVEMARADSAFASARLRLSEFQRHYASAKAHYAELVGRLPDAAGIPRAPVPILEQLTDDALIERAGRTAPVRAAAASARGAAADARAARADTLPNVTAGIDAGRFGVFEPGRRDYDVRGRITLRQRLFGPGEARADEARARSSAAQARTDATRREAERLARIAWSEAHTMAAGLDAYSADYKASRITRDAVLERFRISRGTLFDAIDAEERLFMSAAGYIRALAEHDTAVYVALARSGQLLPALGLKPANRESFK